MENRKPIRFNRVDYWKETCASEEDMGAGFFLIVTNKMWKTEENFIYII